MPFFSTLITQGITTYEWTNNTPSIGLATKWNWRYKCFYSLKSNSKTQLQQTITVTPTFTYNGISCIGNNIQFTITVNPSPEILFSLPNQTICSQENTAEVILSSSAANINFLGLQHNLQVLKGNNIRYR